MTTYEPADWRPEPGEVAEVVWDGETARRVLTDTGAWWSRDGWIPNSAVEHVRRLQVVDPASTVVLDPDNPDDVQRLAVALAKHDESKSAYSVTADLVLRSLLPSPTPPEPNGLGAVVEDARYGPIVRTHEGHWLDRSHSRVEYLPQQVEEITQHGVGCTCGAPDCDGGDQ